MFISGFLKTPSINRKDSVQIVVKQKALKYSKLNCT